MQIVIAADTIHFVVCEAAAHDQLRIRAHAGNALAQTPTHLLWHLPTLQRQLKAFIKMHHLQGASVQVVLCKPYVDESLCYAVNNVATLEQLIDEPHAHHHYAHTLLGPHEDHYLFYVARIPRALLLQIELLCMQVPVRLATISTGFAALLTLYKKVQGKNYRSVDLVQELDLQTVDFSDAIKQQLQARLMPTTQPQHDLAYALGSFLGDL